MPITRREFVRGGVTAFTVGFSAPLFLSDLARLQGQSRRNLVVLYLSGGNDALSTLIPYTDPQYYARRPTLAVPAGSVLQIGSDSSGKALGLHPRLTGLRTIFNAGRLAIVQRTGYPNSSRSHFEGTDIWSTGDPASPQGTGWLGRYLDRLPSPVDPLTAWSTVREIPRTLLVADRRRPGHSQRAAVCVRESQRGRRRAVRAGRGRAHLLAPARRPAAPGLRQRDRAGRVRHARSRRTGGRLSPVGDVSQQRSRAWPCARSPARCFRESARACSGCRPAASTPMPDRAPMPPTARTRA